MHDLINSTIFVFELAESFGNEQTILVLIQIRCPAIKKKRLLRPSMSLLYTSNVISGMGSCLKYSFSKLQMI